MDTAQDKHSEESFLSDELVRQLVAAGQVDILIGVPTYNNVSTIRHVVRTVRTGVAQYFRRDRAVLLAADGGSRDGTVEAVRGTLADEARPLANASPLRTFHQIGARYPGIPSRNSALRTIFASAELLGARAVAVVGGELQTIEPEWIERLVRPAYAEGFDLVTPLYRRHKHDGMLVKNVVYPMVRAVFGCKIREPLGSEMAFSARLVSHSVAELEWRRQQRDLGTELRAICEAIAGDYRICQAVLGTKPPRTRPGAAGLGMVLQQVVGSLFDSMERHESFWRARKEPQEVPTFGSDSDAMLEEARVNRKHLLGQFRNGLTELTPIWQVILTEDTLGSIRELAGLSDRAFRFPDETWTRTLYEFAAAYHHGVMHRDHIVQALGPLYLGRVCASVLEIAAADAGGIEERLEALCQECERMKPYLIERWNAPRRR